MDPSFLSTLFLSHPFWYGYPVWTSYMFSLWDFRVIILGTLVFLCRVLFDSSLVSDPECLLVEVRSWHRNRRHQCPIINKESSDYYLEYYVKWINSIHIIWRIYNTKNSFLFRLLKIFIIMYDHKHENTSLYICTSFPNKFKIFPSSIPPRNRDWNDLQ